MRVFLVCARLRWLAQDYEGRSWHRRFGIHLLRSRRRARQTCPRCHLRSAGTLKCSDHETASAAAYWAWPFSIRGFAPKDLPPGTGCRRQRLRRPSFRATKNPLGQASPQSATCRLDVDASQRATDAHPAAPHRLFRALCLSAFASQRFDQSLITPYLRLVQR